MTSFFSPFRRSLPLACLGALVVFAAALAGCGDGGGTYTIDEVREGTSRGPVPATADSDKRFGASGHGQRAPGAATRAKLEWTYTTPEGWELLPKKPMTDLAWGVQDSDETVCTFTVLQGKAGGLVANVNRWRKQMGLEGQSAKEIEALSTEKFLGLDARRIDLTGSSGRKLLGVVVSVPQATVFLKMTGPAAVVTAEQTNFDALAKSLKAKSSRPTSMPAGHGGMGSMPAGHGARPSAVSWQVPEGWSKKPDRAMREVTFAPAGAKKAEAYIAILGGDGGGVAANINRWRSQMGLKELSADEVKALPRVESLGQEGVLVSIEQGDFTGQAGEKVGGAAMLGFVVLRENDSVFVKMTGPAAEVLPEKENFEAFCRSLTQ